MKIAAIVAVICISLPMGCNQSQSPESKASERSTDTQSSSINTGETSLAISEASLVIIPRQGVGNLEFGMSQIEMERILGKPERAMGMAYEYPGKGMAVLGSKDFAVGAIVFGDMNSPNSPLINACQYKTEKGIGMGSTTQDIVNAYGEPSSVKPMGQLKMLSYKQLEATFTLYDDKVIHMQFRHP